MRIYLDRLSALKKGAWLSYLTRSLINVCFALTLQFYKLLDSFFETFLDRLINLVQIDMFIPYGRSGFDRTSFEH